MPNNHSPTSARAHVIYYLSKKSRASSKSAAQISRAHFPNGKRKRKKNLTGGWQHTHRIWQFRESMYNLGSLFAIMSSLFYDFLYSILFSYCVLMRQGGAPECLSLNKKVIKDYQHLNRSCPARIMGRLHPETRFHQPVCR